MGQRGCQVVAELTARVYFLRGRALAIGLPVLSVFCLIRRRFSLISSCAWHHCQCVDYQQQPASSPLSSYSSYNGQHSTASNIMQQKSSGSSGRILAATKWKWEWNEKEEERNYWRERALIVDIDNVSIIGCYRHHCICICFSDCVFRCVTGAVCP